MNDILVHVFTFYKNDLLFIIMNNISRIFKLKNHLTAYSYDVQSLIKTKHG